MTLIDDQTIANLRELGEDVLKELVDLYLEDAPKQISSIELSLKQMDSEGLRRSAHSLKGASANLGANDLAALCLKMETQGKLKDFSGTEQLLNDINACLKKTSVEMKKLLVSED